METQIARKRKNLAVVGLIALSVFSMMVASVQQAYAQQQGEEQVASDGGLRATLNGDTFRRGDTITVSGTVVDREIGSNAVIRVIDPLGERVESGFPRITADNAFIYSFLANMETTGNYLIEVRYTTPDRDREAIEFVFAYVGDEEVEDVAEIEEAVVVGAAAVINITAINQTAAQALEDLHSLNATLINSTVGINGDVATAQAEEDIQQIYINSIENALLNIQGNVTFSVPLEEVQVVGGMVEELPRVEGEPGQ